MRDVVALRLGLQQERAAELEGRLRRLLAPLTGRERALDSGCGTGALAFALAPLVGEVVGVDTSEEYVAAAAAQAPPNVTVAVGDAMELPFGYGEFDLAGCARLLHHVRRPELVVSELVRVTRPGGRIVIVDQLGSVDPMRSLEQDRFERARDPSHSRLLPDADIRGFLDANDLIVLANEVTRETRHVDAFLDLAGVQGEDRERLRRMAPALEYDIEIGWYVARKPGAA